MAWLFADSFDFYTALADLASHWTEGIGVANNMSLNASGRFSGSQCIANNSIVNGQLLVKSSGSNDATHHIVVAFMQTSAITGSTLGLYFQFIDAAANQCCIVFRSDGAILLTSGTPGGTILATYTSAYTQNVWVGFEFEVTIHLSAGVFKVRKNGNTSDDFSATGLATRPGSTNAYANKLLVGQSSSSPQGYKFDDLLWFNTTGAAPNTWVGDIRSCQLMPTSDASVQFTPNSGANNFSRVNQAQQDALTSYVYDSTVGHADFYNVSALPFVPVSIIGLQTRGFVEKSDAGFRQAQLQLKSGATTVQTTALTLATSFQYTNRVDTVDPNTSAAWTAAAVNAIQVGPYVTA
jgi:hypothetical protein